MARNKSEKELAVERSNRLEPGLSRGRHQMAATSAPFPCDDEKDGYTVGSIWMDTTTDTVYLCTDAAALKAKWAVLSGADHGVFCPGCFKRRPDWIPLENRGKKDWDAVLAYSMCCNKECNGDWGTGCHHCHHPRFWRDNQ